MAQQVQLLISIAISVLALSACQYNGKIDLTINIAEHTVIARQGITHVDAVPYTGMIYSLYPSSTDTVFIKTYVNGMEHGKWTYYYSNHSVKESREFVKGEKTGDHLGYFSEGQMSFHYQLEHDVYHGIKREWTEDGTIIKEMHYEKGQESGSQKVWYTNGKIKSNYVIKNHRRYGLLGTKNCVNVSDSIFSM